MWSPMCAVSSGNTTAYAILNANCNIQMITVVVKLCLGTEGKLKFAFCEENLCLSVEVPGGFVFEPWCVTTIHRLPFTPGLLLPEFCPPILTPQGEGFQRRENQKLREETKSAFQGLVCGNQMRGLARIWSPSNHEWYAEGISLKLKTKLLLWIRKPDRRTMTHQNFLTPQTLSLCL